MCNHFLEFVDCKSWNHDFAQIVHTDDQITGDYYFIQWGIVFFTCESWFNLLTDSLRLLIKEDSWSSVSGCQHTWINTRMQKRWIAVSGDLHALFFRGSVTAVRFRDEWHPCIACPPFHRACIVSQYLESETLFRMLSRSPDLNLWTCMERIYIHFLTVVGTFF